MATSYLSEFLPIFSDASRPYLTLQLVRCFNFVATTMWQTPSWYSTDCIFRNGSTSNWHSWHIEYCTVWRQSTWINSFRYQTYQVAAACGCRLHFSCSFRRTVWQPSAVARFLLLHYTTVNFVMAICHLSHVKNTDWLIDWLIDWWQVTLCDPKVTPHSSDMGLPWRAVHSFNLFICYMWWQNSP